MIFRQVRMASSGAEGGGIEAVVKRRLHAMGIVGGLNAADGSCMDLNRRVVVLVVLVGVVSGVGVVIVSLLLSLLF